MTTFPGSPKLIKGALVSIDLDSSQASTIAFQYNPHTLTRSLDPQMMGGTSGRMGGGSYEPLRIQGAPTETISLDIEIDATDQMEKGQGTAEDMSIYPQLSALEMLIYPPLQRIKENCKLLEQGTIEIAPPEAPLTLFVWGKNRVIPVQLTSFRITEEAHDINLNPVQAKVSLSLRVLSYNDLPCGHKGHSYFMAHQESKEALAAKGRVGGLSPLVGSGVRLL
jgi:hypothetical protein